MRRYWKAIVLGLLLISAISVIFWPLPDTSRPFSSVVLASDGSLLSARIAADQQWRFPKPDSVPERIRDCIIHYEDEYFYYHPGFNPVSIVRAIYQNVKADRIVSGASTITMQLCRMLYNEDRTFLQKLKEIIASVHMELFTSKDEILRLYTTHAPYGGNIVGLEAASWKYYGRAPAQLSWAESALLAVLPNDPSRLYPGKDNQKLLAKRNTLLEKLYNRQIIDKTTMKLAVSEPLPDRPKTIDFTNMHLLDRCTQLYGTDRHQTTVDPRWQNLTNKILKKHHYSLSKNGIENLAALVIDLEQNSVLAYTGNIANPAIDEFQVDIIPSKRSSGSLLKPFLYALAIDKGQLTPNFLLPDIPTYFAGFTPKNFNEKYDGMVPASAALSRSLNIPFVHLLKEYQFEQFQVDLANLQLTTIDQNTDRYGLSLVLGGAEITLWEIAQTYSQLYRRLAGFEPKNVSLTNAKNENSFEWSPPSKIATWYMFDAMTELVRPGTDKNWEKFESSQEIAWKTGTSFGFRDAWAVGLNGKVLAAVWAGNADGEGRAGLIGSKAAGPVLLELLSLSDYKKDWLNLLKPVEKQWKICTASGYKASPLCAKTVELDLPNAGALLPKCTFHQKVVLDPTKSLRINSACFPLYKSMNDTLFILPASIGDYYVKTHPGYKGLPPLHPDCMENNSKMEIVYPTKTSKVYLPQKNTTKEKVILQAAHQSKDATVYWHIDNKYIGSTQYPHNLSVSLHKGVYLLKITDQNGQEASRTVEVISE